MKGINKKQKLIAFITIILIVVILAIVIITNIIDNEQVASEKYSATIANANSNIVASYIKEGITIGGITGTLEDLDTSDATALPEDIAWGETAYVDGKKIVGTRLNQIDGVSIPNGFYYVGGTKQSGLIISDNINDSYKYSSSNWTDQANIPSGVERVDGINGEISPIEGNQFVFVPVEDSSKIFEDVEEGVKLNGVETTTNVYSKLTISNSFWEESGMSVGIPGETTKIREPDLISGDETNYTMLGFQSAKEMADYFVAEYKNMSDSIKKYKGFYIGRFELTGTIESPQEKPGDVLTVAEAENWFTLYKTCQNVIKGNENVKSTMIYGVQWDTVCDWLNQNGYNTVTDSSSWGNYSLSPLNTGSSNYQAQGIFDIAGNFWEWTQEAGNSTYRAGRGGECRDSGTGAPASGRGYVGAVGSRAFGTSRAVIYF